MRVYYCASVKAYIYISLTNSFVGVCWTFIHIPLAHNLPLQVGFYTQVLGLGTWPSAVRFTGHQGVFGPSEEDNNNFNTFWKAGNGEWMWGFP